MPRTVNGTGHEISLAQHVLDYDPGDCTEESKPTERNERKTKMLDKLLGRRDGCQTRY